MDPYSQKDIDDAVAIIEARYGVPVRFDRAFGFSFYDPQTQQKLTNDTVNGVQFVNGLPAGASQREFWDILDQQHQKNDPGPKDDDQQQAPPKNWWQRTLNSPQARAVLRPVRRYVGTLAAVGVVADIRAAGNIGQQAAANITAGAQSFVGNAYGAGAQIGQAIVDGLMQPLGQTGQAVSRFSQTLSKTIGDALTSAVNTGGKLLGTAGKIIGTGVGVVTGGAGALIGAGLGLAVGNAPGALIGAALGSAVGVAIMKAIESVSEAVGGALGQLGALFGKFGEIATSAIKSIQDVLQDVTNTASKYAQGVATFSAYTGVGLGAATGTINNFALAGIPAQQTQGLFQAQDQLPEFFRMKAGLFHLPDYTNPEFMPQLAERFQGQRSPIMRRVMMQEMGLDSNPQMMMAATMDPAKLRSNIAYGQNLQSSLGMNPAQIQGFAQDWTLLTERVSFFVEMAKAKIGSELLPFLTRGLEVATSWLSAHGGDIGSWIQRGAQIFIQGVEWMMVNTPSLVVRGLQMIVQATMGFLHGVALVAHTMAGFLRSLQTDNSGFLNFVGNFLQAIDFVSVGFVGLWKALAIFGAALWDMLTLLPNIELTIINTLIKPFTALGGAALRALGVDPNVVKAVQGFQIPTIPMIDPIDFGKKLNTIQPADYYGQFQNFRGALAGNQTITNTANTLDTFGDATTKAADTTLGGWSKTLGDFAPTVAPDKMQTIVDQFGKGVSQFTATTAKGMKLAIDLRENPDALMRVSGYVAEDQIEMANRE